MSNRIAATGIKTALLTIRDLRLMRTTFIKLFNLLLVGTFVAFYSANVGAQTPSGGDVVMVLPFENTSNRPEYNWVGESFADSLAELLNKPGLLVVSSDERELAYQQLRLPETVTCILFSDAFQIV